MNNLIRPKGSIRDFAASHLSDLFQWLTAFFSLTEEEKMEAGVYFGDRPFEE